MVARPTLSLALAGAALLAGIPVVASARDPVAIQAGAAESFSVPYVLRSVLPQVKRRTRVPVLLPSRAPAYVERGRLSAEGSGAADGYNLSLGSAPNCGGATACFVAEFSAKRGGRPAFRRTVRLTRGIRGYFKPLTCGASCSPPQIQWVQRGVLYDFQYAGAARTQERGVVVRLANSAIRAGPR